MIYLLLSICCSVTVAALLKLAKRYKINVPQAVTWNYLFAILLSYLFFRPAVAAITLGNIFTPVNLALAILLPTIFWFLAASVRNIGIVKTDIAQRLSLFIPILASYFIFKEQFSNLKIAGLAVGFTAIFLTLSKSSRQKSMPLSYIYPLIVFLGFGLIDVLFKQIARISIIPYTTSLFLVFVLAFFVSLVIIAYLYFTRKQKLELVNFLCGCILGLFNFGNILFYLKAHRAMAENPSTVFAAMNMGVVILGSLVGIFVFKEKLSKLNFFGLVLALTAIFLIALSQYYAV